MGAPSGSARVEPIAMTAASRHMNQDRFEWLEIPEEPKLSARGPRTEVEAVVGKRCPQCGWLDEETATICFQCGYRYNLDHDMAGRFEQLGVTLQPRIIEGGQSFEAFFRVHGRTREPEATGFYKLRLQAEAIRLSRGFDRLLALEELDVEHYQHQIDTALKALNQMRGRALLADEVGLGKTIEAGIIMKELIQRGLVRTVLILTPSSLTEQWREELENKFHENFTTISRARDWDNFKTYDDGRWIASLDRAKRKDHAAGILAREYDLLIVDEAHKLKNRSTIAWKFVNQIRKRYVLMLTATPVQNDLMELYSLITILAPGQLGTVRGFRQHFLQQADARRPKNAPSLRRLLNDIMIRNRRSKVEVAFPRRRAAIYHLSLSEPEWQLYADVTDYIRRRFRSVESDKHLRLTLMTLQRELSSSPQAVASTLRKMVQDSAYGDRARSELLGFLAQAESIPRGRKLEAVREILDRYPGKFLIFTEYRSTLDVILKALKEWGISAVGFHGGLNIRQKEAAVATFRGDGDSGGNDGSTNFGDEPGARVMVSTESGAEGRNLQFCHQLINYDLPWNPMRVEQRIGRLHRLGQEHDVTIFNLSCDETIEAHVINLLARKIRMFELVIGELDMILGNIEGSKSFEDLIRQAWEASRNEGDLRERFDEIGSILVRARRDFDRIRESNELLDEYLDNV